MGSFSDISMICGSWQVCGVNLSIGYYNEHTEREMLFLDSMYNTITRVIKMLSIKNIPHFKWEGMTYIPEKDFDWMNYYNLVPYNVACKHCHKPLEFQEACGADNNAGGISYYCWDCLIDHVSYCPSCGNPFENKEGISSHKICPRCEAKGEKDEGDIFEF